MPNEEILKYVKDCLGKNYSIEQIRQSLIQAGWGNSQIDEALLSAQTVPTEEQKVSPRPKVPPAIIAGTILVVVGAGITLSVLMKNSTASNQVTERASSPSGATTTAKINVPVRSGTLGQATTSATTVSIKSRVDCGSDTTTTDQKGLLRVFSNTESCFYKQLKTCNFSTAKTPPNPTKIRFQYDIESAQGDSCSVQISTIGYPAATDLPPDPSGSLSVLKELKNTSMKCEIPKSLQSGGLSQLKDGWCTGSLEDVFKKSTSNINVWTTLVGILNWGNFKIDIHANV